MDYVTQKFENTNAGLAQKDAYSAKMAQQGYRIVSEQAEPGHAKGGEQCCLFAICLPCVFLAGRTPGTIVVTYGRDVSACPACGSAVMAGRRCEKCHQLANDKAQQAALTTAQVRKSGQRLENLLADSVSVDYRFNWQSLHKEFNVPAPNAPPTPKLKTVPMLARIVQGLTPLGRMIPSLRRYQQKWIAAREHDAREQMAAFEQYPQALADWQKSRESFDHDQIAYVEAKERQYLSKDRSTLVDYWARILEKPVYLEQPPCVRNLDYRDTDNRLVVEYALPTISQLPVIEEVRYNPATRTLEEVHFSPAQLHRLYGDLVVKTTLIVLFKLFQSDVAEALRRVVFNGTVTVIDRATGNHKSPCIVAIEVEKSEFSKLNFSRIDPIACFKGLKGTVSANLIELDPVSLIT